MSLRSAAMAMLVAAAIAGCAAGGGGPVGGSKRPRDVNDPKQQASELQVKLGQEYMARGQLETALEKLKRAIKIDPSSIDGHTVLAILYERIDRQTLAEAAYRRAVELDPEGGSTNNNMGAFLCRLGRFPDAEKYFLRAVEDPFYQTPEAALANAGVCAARSGLPEAAEKYFRRTLEADPANAGALYEMAAISFRKKEYLSARAFIQRFEAVAPPDAGALDFGARIEEQLGDTAAAAKYRARLKTEFPDYEPGKAQGGSNSP
jgi:type IV pilus assembly protein PilF